MSELYADIIIDITARELDRTFQYRVPDELLPVIKAGSMVEIPFGKGNSLKKGYVISLGDKPHIDRALIKDISGMAGDTSLAEPALVRLAAWMAENYGSTTAAALRVVFPVKRKVKLRAKPEELTAEEAAAIEELTAEQRAAIDGVLGGYDAGERGVSLIRGITGSGKTEVYIEIAKGIVERGGQVIVLIPEIALTRQTELRFYRCFGDRVSTIHSRLSAGEKYDRFERAARSETDVVIGPRSALFTPFAHLKAIIIDEEHESSYKSEQTPKYHARETAIHRAKECGAMVVLGSATPSVDSYFKAKEGLYRLYELKNRATGGELARARIVDLRAELKNGNRTPISDRLRESIEKRLEAGEQTILFLNRRGFAGFVSCRSCGFVYKCPHCDVALSMHDKGGRGGALVCHYCGYTESFKKLCPECGSRFVGTMKAGTQAIERVVKEMFPTARVLRMDMDTTKGKSGHSRILESFANGKADILIGTQMIVKGHDFPNVTLVGILAADLSLFAPDYRAGERTFALLTQAAGRAGRGERRGEVIIQTYNPENPYILASAKQDYEAFYEHEIAYRQLLDYPPSAHMLVALFESGDADSADRASQRAAERARELTGRFKAGEGSVQVFGPSTASISYINDVHRRILYLKSREYAALVMIKDELDMMDRDGAAISFDFDPVSGY